MARERATRALTSSVNLALIALVLVYVAFEARGGVALERGSSTEVSDVLWFAVLCGLAAFASIEILKRVFDLRGWYQQRQVEVWLDRRGGWLAYHELLQAMGLAGYNDRLDRRRVFSLPAEQLVAQISAAADVALAESRLERKPRGDEPPELTYHEFLRALAGVPEQRGSEMFGGDENTGIERSQRVRSGIDQLQISIGERWRRYVQSAAVWISGVYGIALIHSADVGRAAEARYVLAALVIGGPVAWVARDLAAIVERARR